MTRYIDEKTGECYISYNSFLTNGKKVYRGKMGFEKERTLKRLTLLYYNKFNLDKIIKNIKRFHPNCPEVAILENLKNQLTPFFVGMYDTWSREVVDYFITLELPYVMHGCGGTKINEQTPEERYVSYSTAFLGKMGNPTVEDLQDESILNSFLNKEVRKNTYAHI